LLFIYFFVDSTSLGVCRTRWKCWISVFWKQNWTDLKIQKPQTQVPCSSVSIDQFHRFLLITWLSGNHSVIVLVVVQTIKGRIVTSLPTPKWPTSCLRSHCHCYAHAPSYQSIFTYRQLFAKCLIIIALSLSCPPSKHSVLYICYVVAGSCQPHFWNVGEAKTQIWRVSCFSTMHIVK